MIFKYRLMDEWKKGSPEVIYHVLHLISPYAVTSHIYHLGQMSGCYFLKCLLKKNHFIYKRYYSIISVSCGSPCPLCFLKRVDLRMGWLDWFLNETIFQNLNILPNSIEKLIYFLTSGSFKLKAFTQFGQLPSCYSYIEWTH